MTDLEKHYHAMKAATDAEYWQFSRRANYNPTRMSELAAETERARRAWQAQQRTRAL